MCTSKHWILCRYTLVVKRSQTHWYLLDNTVQIVNCIKAQPLNSRLFKLLCSDMGSEYETLMCHAKVCWLSRGEVRTLVFQLMMKLCFFFVWNRNTISQLYLRCVLGVAAGVPHWYFQYVKWVHLPVQGDSITVLTAEGKVAAVKLHLYLGPSVYNKLNFGAMNEYFED